MSVKLSVEMLGDKKLREVFDALPDRLRQKIMKPAMRKGGKIILGRAISYAPFKTGNLRGSLELRAFTSRKKGAFGYMVQTAGGMFKGEGFYGAFVELGTFKVPPRPFLRPALKASEGEVIALVSSEIAKKLKREAKRGRY